MFGIRTWRALRRRGVMGINQRNGDYVLAYNDRRLYPLVDDKIRTKKLALDAGIQVPDMYGIIDTEQGISKLQHIVETHGDFVIKPAQGAGGDGIMVISDRFEGYYRGASGRMISPEELEFHISGIISGIYSLGGHRDRALIEYRVRSTDLFDRISIGGVPDVRIIVLKGKVEEVKIEEKVDIIISEPMGFLLIHERMLESFCVARTRFLKPGGLMFPTTGTIFAMPISNGTLYSEQQAKVE